MKARLLVVVVSALAGFSWYQGGKYFEISKNIEIYTNVYKELNTWYVDELDPATVMRHGIDAMVSNLDPYPTTFLKVRSKDTDMSLRGNTTVLEQS